MCSCCRTRKSKLVTHVIQLCTNYNSTCNRWICCLFFFAHAFSYNVLRSNTTGFVRDFRSDFGRAICVTVQQFQQCGPSSAIVVVFSCCSAPAFRLLFDWVGVLCIANECGVDCAAFVCVFLFGRVFNLSLMRFAIRCFRSDNQKNYAVWKNTKTEEKRTLRGDDLTKSHLHARCETQPTQNNVLNDRPHIYAIYLIACCTSLSLNIGCSVPVHTQF